ncbi:MAG: ABC transporter permease subunit, partial [Chloroflexota bacterium]
MNWLTNSAAWSVFFNTNLWQATLLAATPLTLPALGGVISERSGVVNIAMEGMMLTGAFFAVFFDIIFGNAAVGLLAAIITGGIMALLHAYASIRWKADQIISGMAINLMALGLTSYLLFTVYGINGPPTACTP